MDGVWAPTHFRGSCINWRHSHLPSLVSAKLEQAPLGSFVVPGEAYARGAIFSSPSWHCSGASSIFRASLARRLSFSLPPSSPHTEPDSYIWGLHKPGDLARPLRKLSFCLCDLGRARKLPVAPTLATLPVHWTALWNNKPPAGTRAVLDAGVGARLQTWPQAECPAKQPIVIVITVATSSTGWWFRW